MLNEIANSPSAGFERLLERADFTSDAAFRTSYLTHHLRAFLADQIRALRGERSQREFGRALHKPQSVISRLEDEEYGKLTLQTLVDIATKLDIALLVRFVDYPTFLRETNDLSDEKVAPASYNREAINQMLLVEKRRLEAAQGERGGAQLAFEQMTSEQRGPANSNARSLDQPEPHLASGSLG
jgi:hypothetical protein